MYYLINEHIQNLLQSIHQGHVNHHVNEYDFLIQNINQVETVEYQRRYGNYWQLNAARLYPAFRQAYFELLQGNLNHNPNNLRSITEQLYNTPVHANGQQAIQFSFATKLLHMVNQNTPIYDSKVSSFFFFIEPSRYMPVPQRINAFVNFHEFLVGEYGRVLDHNLLADSIHQFRRQFNPQHFTDVKIIDSLIWAFVSMLNNGGQINGQVIYS